MISDKCRHMYLQLLGIAYRFRLSPYPVDYKKSRVLGSVGRRRMVTFLISALLPVFCDLLVLTWLGVNVITRKCSSLEKAGFFALVGIINLDVLSRFILTVHTECCRSFLNKVFIFNDAIVKQTHPDSSGPDMLAHIFQMQIIHCVVVSLLVIPAITFTFSLAEFENLFYGIRQENVLLNFTLALGTSAVVYLNLQAMNVCLGLAAMYFKVILDTAVLVSAISGGQWKWNEMRRIGLLYRGMQILHNHWLSIITSTMTAWYACGMFGALGFASAVISYGNELPFLAGVGFLLASIATLACTLIFTELLWLVRNATQNCSAKHGWTRVGDRKNKEVKFWTSCPPLSTTVPHILVPEKDSFVKALRFFIDRLAELLLT